MSDGYVIGIDQSTQGTKALLFDDRGTILARAAIGHKQYVNEKGWVSHDVEEIYQNVIRVCGNLLDKQEVDRRKVRCIGISNQRETTVAWNRRTGHPYEKAIVWQCNRAEAVCRRIEESCDADREIYRTTGIKLNPYYPASKMAWLLENVPGLRADAEAGIAALGTIDSWLIYKLTKGNFYIEASNASRTQLLNLNTVTWDENVCRIFGIPMAALPEIKNSDFCYGETNLEGVLSACVPVTGVMGDSHAAVFGHNCRNAGDMKVTYGTGSSVALNTGSRMILSDAGLSTSIAWKREDSVAYILEGNINYAGAVFTWLGEDVKLIQSSDEIEEAIAQANPRDMSFLVPAFSGLGAPWWAGDAKAAIVGMNRSTGKNELMKAACESIGYQVNDVIEAMRQDTGAAVSRVRVDGGPTKNRYLMQFQSDISNVELEVPSAEELSAIGAAYLAGLSQGVYDETVFDSLRYEKYLSRMSETMREDKIHRWKHAVRVTMEYH